MPCSLLKPMSIPKHQDSGPKLLSLAQAALLSTQGAANSLAEPDLKLLSLVAPCVVLTLDLHVCSARPDAFPAVC